MRSIRDFLRGRHILLTGGTGFLGKALIEKILRAAPDIGRLYVLVRPRQRPDGGETSAAERLKREVFETSIFSRLKQQHGETFWDFIDERVVAISGNLADDGLGLSDDHVALLRDNCDTVLHGAASVFFDERIDHAVQMNSLGPKRLIELTRTFVSNPIFAFVSTCYVSGIRRGAVPEVQPPADKSAAQLAGVAGAVALDVERELAAIEAVTAAVHAEAESAAMTERLQAEARRETTDELPFEDALNAARKRWLVKRLVDEGMDRARRLGWHEVYTFTKAMGERLLFANRGDVPVALVRPSIIESSVAEPEPGWLNGLKVADPLIAGYAKGRLPDFPGDREAVLDLIPVDFVANAILAALERLDRERQLEVYHVATGARNPIRVGTMFELMQEYYRRHPMRDKRGEPIRAMDWSFPDLGWFRARYKYQYLVPASTAARALRAVGVLPEFAGKLEKVADNVKKLLYYLDIYGPYTSLNAIFESDNTKRLFDGLTDEDKTDFNFDVEGISWPTYIQDIHLSGLDRHVLRFGRGSGGRKGSTSGPLSTEDLRTLPDLLRISAERFGDKVALQIKRGDTWVRLTYRELYERAGKMGARWRAAGLDKGQHVLLIAENQPEWAIAHMAAQAVGATVVPIDIHTPSTEIQEIIDFTDTVAVISSRATYPSLPKTLLSSPLPIWNLNNDGLPFEDRPATSAPAEPGEVFWEDVSPDDIASIIFTSGPAVDPRGVMLSHRNFLSNLLALSEVLRSYETDRFVSVLPLHHALEFTGGLLMPLFSGAIVTYAQSLRSNVVLETMRETGATALLAVPRIFEMLLDKLRRSSQGYPDGERSPELDSFVNQVRLLVSGGAPLDISIYEGFAELGFPIHEGYGLTESAPILTVNPLWGVRARSVGKTLPGVELRIEPEPGRDEDGEGEIVVRGPNIMRGYFKNPKATAHVLKEGWLWTGDIGRLDSDGYLTITGRSKELIVTGAGKNVWPEEVELFYRDLDGIQEIAVFGVRLPGATRETVHAAVYIQTDPEPILDAVHRIAHERPSYQRIQHVHFRELPLPRLEDGRPDRKALRDEAIVAMQTKKRAKKRAKQPDHAAWWERDTLAILARIAVRDADEGVAPRERLTQLYDSLQLIDLVSALEGRFGVTVDENEIANLDTVGDVLARVKEAVGDRPEPPPGEHDEPLESDYWTRVLARAETAGPPEELQASAAMRPLQSLFLATAGLTMRLLFRQSVRGLDRLPADTPFLIAANHSSHLDTFAILTALRGQVDRVHVAAARDYFFDTKLKGWFFRNFLNVVPFDREKNFLTGFRAAQSVLKPGEPLLIFPEGTRSPTGRLQPFKVGLGILALELGATVVPTRIRGTHEAMPKGASLPRPHRVDIAFGEAIEMTEFRERRGSVNAYALYREIVDRVRQRVEQLIDEA